MKIKLLFLVISSVYCSSSFAGIGEDIASKISARYDQTVDDCGSTSSPAYECAGVVLHGDANQNESMPWAPPSDNSMSYSYLRKDVLNPIFASFDFGIILTPQNEIEDGKYKPNYTCTFPINGSTNSRLEDGCGAFESSPPLAESASCQSQGLLTTSDWIAAYKLDSLVQYCGWDLKTDDPTGAFQAMMGSSAYYLDNSSDAFANNEIVIASWGDEPVSNLPIEAIFYAERINSRKQYNTRTLLKAQEAQLNYYDITGEWLPIIHMIESSVGPTKYQYSFSYIESEQVVPPTGFDDKKTRQNKSK